MVGPINTVIAKVNLAQWTMVRQNRSSGFIVFLAMATLPSPKSTSLAISKQKRVLVEWM
jgi:hypothetical protein